MQHGLSEPVPIPDVYCSGIGTVEDVGGGCLRFWLYVNQQALYGEAPAERVVVAKIIVPASAIPESVMQTLITVGVAASNVIPLVADLVN